MFIKIILGLLIVFIVFMMKNKHSTLFDGLQVKERSQTKTRQYCAYPNLLLYFNSVELLIYDLVKYGIG